MSTPAIPELLDDPCINFRLKRWLREALAGDPLDAYYDAQLLAAALKQRIDELLERDSRHAS